jgi:hypothetical protein
MEMALVVLGTQHNLVLQTVAMEEKVVVESLPLFMDLLVRRAPLAVLV